MDPEALKEGKKVVWLGGYFYFLYSHMDAFCIVSNTSKVFPKLGGCQSLAKEANFCQRVFAWFIYIAMTPVAQSRSLWTSIGRVLPLLMTENLPKAEFNLLANSDIWQTETTISQNINFSRKDRVDFINGASIFSLDEFSNLHVHIYFRVLLELHCKDRTHIHPDSYHWKIHITRAPIVTFGTFIEISLSLEHNEDKWATKGNFTYAWFPDLQRPIGCFSQNTILGNSKSVSSFLYSFTPDTCTFSLLLPYI